MSRICCGSDSFHNFVRFVASVTCQITECFQEVFELRLGQKNASSEISEICDPHQRSVPQRQQGSLEPNTEQTSCKALATTSSTITQLHIPSSRYYSLNKSVFMLHCVIGTRLSVRLYMLPQDSSESGRRGPLTPYPRFVPARPSKART